MEEGQVQHEVDRDFRVAFSTFFIVELCVYEDLALPNRDVVLITSRFTMTVPASLLKMASVRSPPCASSNEAFLPRRPSGSGFRAQ